MDKLHCELRKTFDGLSIGSVLEVGTGRGNFMEILLDTFSSDTHCTGIDLKDEYLKIAKENFQQNNVTFSVMNAEALTFEDDSFDVVCISNTLHHLPDYNKVLSEMKRVLKPTGHLIMNEMFCDHLTNKQHTHVWLHHFSADIDHEFGTFHDKTYKKNRLIQIVEDNDFNIIHQFESQTHEEQLTYEDLNQEKEILDNTFAAFKRGISKIEDGDTREKFLQTLLEKTPELYEAGFFAATSLTVIGKK